MHKLESFALSCGSKISKPHIEKTFYPILDKKFICVSQKALSQAEDYEYFDDVVFHIKPYLDQNDIKIFELGDSSRKPLFYSKGYRHLNRLQASYVLDRSLLYLGNLNLYSHIASHYSKPVITPLNNQYVNTIKPYWADDEYCKLITPDVETKPTFSPQENPKTINQIPPEVVASAVLDCLSIEHSLDKIETIYTGEEYNNQIIDVVPGSYRVDQMNINGVVNLRMDKHFDLNFLAACSNLQSINIVTDKAIPAEHLNLLKNKINFISIFVDHKTTHEDINLFSSIGKPLNLLCKDTKKINEIRLKFIDHQIKIYGKKSKKDLKTRTYSNLKFLSKRNVISHGQVFNSYLSLSLNENTSTVKNQKEFWEDLPFCRVFKENS